MLAKATLQQQGPITQLQSVRILELQMESFEVAGGTVQDSVGTSGAAINVDQACIFKHF
jgi:hypothetical protein